MVGILMIPLLTTAGERNTGVPGADTRTCSEKLRELGVMVFLTLGPAPGMTILFLIWLGG